MRREFNMSYIYFKKKLTIYMEYNFSNILSPLASSAKEGKWALAVSIIISDSFLKISYYCSALFVLIFKETGACE